MTAAELRAGPDGMPLLVWRFEEPMVVASTAAAGGGVGLRQWVVNTQVPGGYSRRDPERHVQELAEALDLSGPGVGMFTAADVTVIRRAQDGGASVEATVGITHPTWAAAPDEPQSAVPGTINIVAVLPEPLPHAGLLNALCTVTEAKTQALLTAGVAGTGTPSDAVTVACPPGPATAQFGGPRSTWGARLARAVYDAVLMGCPVRWTPGDAP